MPQIEIVFNFIIYNVYFKLILTVNTKTWNRMKRNRSKIQDMDTKFYRRIAGKTIRGRIRSEDFRAETGTQNLLTELDEKW